MALDSEGTRLVPTIIVMDDLLDEVVRGHFRIPEFQRPFVWRPDQMLDLFDSIERGYPIGSLLLWQTDQPVPTLSRVGGLEVPSEPTSRSVSYVLDGHQRLSTLVGALRYRQTASADEQLQRWRIYRDLREGGTDRYLHHRSSGPAPSHYLPMASVSRTMDFLAFSRRLETSERNTEALERLITAAENIAQRIKNYQIALLQLIGGSLDQAVDVYTRLNRTGTRMDADQVVSALTYKVPGRPPLSARIDEIVEDVAETGFGLVPRLAVFRAVLAIAGEADVMSPRWESVARDVESKLHDAVPATGQAVRLAIDFLRHGVRVPLAKLVPYAHQLTLLTVFFHHCAEPRPRQLDGLRTWFWRTSWASAFAGANSTTLRRALDEMKGFAAGGSDLTLPPDDQILPVPDKFIITSARTRAYVIWELAEFPERLGPDGNPIDVVSLLASADPQVYRPVIAGDQRPANRMVFPVPSGSSVRKALLEVWAADARGVLVSNGVPQAAIDRLREHDGPGFVQARMEFLDRRIRRFAADLGVHVADELTGDAEDDTE